MVSVLRSSLTELGLGSSQRTSLTVPIPVDVPSTDDDGDTDTVTVTTRRSPSYLRARHSNEDLRRLAVSAQLTEISYNISDLQTRVFEIQELRHQAVTVPEAGPSTEASTSAIDNALMNFDERLEAVSNSIDELDKAVEELSSTSRTPTQSSEVDESVDHLLRKRTEVLGDWASVQRESEELRKELADDKWLVVFRTVTEQADNMMASLEKILTQCQDFMWQVQRRHVAEPFITGLGSLTDPPTIDYDHYLALANNLEAKKTYYMPSINKILSILDKGIREHTKNGECLRRHAESRARWRTLRDRIGRVDSQMDGIRKALSSEVNEAAPSEPDSVSSRTSKTSKSSYTPGLKSRTSSSLSLSRSISPFRKFAQRVSNSVTGGAHINSGTVKAPSSDPPNVRSRASIFFRRDKSPQISPGNSKHSYSQSLLVSPASDHNESPSRASVDTPTKPRRQWNSSTRIDGDVSNHLTVKPKARRLSSSVGTVFAPSADAPPVPPLPGPRSISRTSIGSSRPWSPLATNSTMSTSSSHFSPRPSISRPQSRTADSNMPPSPRARPKTPSHIPTPTSNIHSFLGSTGGAESPLTQRAISPTASASGRRSVAAYVERSKTPSRIPTPRAPSGSYLGLPGSLSRPSSSLMKRIGAQTPETTIRARALQLPIYRGVQTPRPSMSRGPPSSFRGDSNRTTPILDRKITPSTEPNPLVQYTPNLKDPLDVEVAKTVNGIAHGFLFERIDPPLRVAPSEGQELRAQYAVSNALGRKVINCRLVVIKRANTTIGDSTSKKVMCRVGGGWLDLHMYLLNHQLG